MRPLVGLACLWLCACASQFSQTSFSNLFRDNNQDDVRSILGRLPPPAAQERPSNTSGRPMVIATTYALKRSTKRSIVGYDPAAGREVFRVPAAPASRPTVAGPVFLVGADRDVVAYSVQDGHEMWRHDCAGMQYLGAAYDDGVVYVTAAVPGGARIARVTALRAETGGKLWDQMVDKALGVPAARGGLVFVPWDRQNLTVLDGRTGDELARIRLTDDVLSWVLATAEGVYYGSKGIYRLDTRSSAGTKEDTTYFAPVVREIPGQPEFFYDAFAPPTGGRNARDRIRFHWRPAATTGTGQELGIADGTIYLLYYRFVFAFDAATGSIKWAYRHGKDLSGMQVTASGVFLAGDDGELLMLDAASGQPRWHTSTGSEIASVAFDLTGFAPEANMEAPAPVELRARLTELVLDPDNRLIPIRQFALRELAKLDIPEVTRDLLEIYSQSSTPEALKQVIALSLRERRTGGAFLVEALGRHYDFIEDSKPYPLQVVAPTLVAMQERSAVPGLIDHMMDHETSNEALKEIVAAVVALGDASVVPPLRDFVVRYHADSSFSQDPTALALAIDGLVRLGEVGERELLTKLAGERSTLAPVSQHVREALEAREAALRAEEAARQAAAQQAQAAQEPQRPQRVVPFRLSVEEVNATFDAHRDELRLCIETELQTNPTLQVVRFAMVLNGDGSVKSVMVAPGSQTMQDCLGSKVRAYRFPTFRDVRMPATFQMRGAAAAVRAQPQPEPPPQQGPQAPQPGAPVPGQWPQQWPQQWPPQTNPAPGSPEPGAPEPPMNPQPGAPEPPANPQPGAPEPPASPQPGAPEPPPSPPVGAPPPPASPPVGAPVPPASPPVGAPEPPP
ncbi:MAG: PQQ-binding-like beta-propeller repeat protein [Deltaproteobacteria bacterium]|nr:PQQ-binding-like beta-propeller repeat protein [Deltaproteobacteria bacterium]